MIKQTPMNDRQAELINSAFLVAKNAKRELDLLLEGMASGLEGKLIDADTDKRVFNLETPDEETTTAENKM